MTTPFAPFANARIAFNVAIGALSTDAITGNVVAAETTVVITAYLTTSTAPRALYYPGVDESEQILEGYVVDDGGNNGTAKLPLGINDQAKGYAEFSDASGVTLKGLFTIRRAVVTGIDAIVESVTGAEISGTFRAQAPTAGGVPPTSLP